MRRLADILIAFKEYVLLSLCITASVFLLAASDNSQMHRIRAVTIGGLGRAQDLLGFLPNYFSLQNENRALRELNVTLADEAARLREAGLENARLRRLLGLKDRDSPRAIPAEVVGKSLQLLRNTVTLNVGTADGVRPGMPIVTGEGLVGRVVAAGEDYCVGQILLNTGFRVSAKVQRGRVDGIVAWEGGDRLLLKNVAKTLDVQPGDAVITSEYSSLFPPGLRIGLVRSTSQEPGALFQDVEIEPAVDFFRLEEAFVLEHSPDSGRTALEQAAPR
ncbi:MAG: rod shape-determining protein MreC [Bacteroidota bacterium]